MIQSKKKIKLTEDADIQRVLPPADADAFEQHDKAVKDHYERVFNPEKQSKAVKELIDDTASTESRYLHFDVVDRNGLASLINRCKLKGDKFKVGRSRKEGFRYDLTIIPIYHSKGALDVNGGDDGDTENILNKSIYESLKLNTAKKCEKNGTSGYLINDGGDIKFLKNYTRNQVEDLGFNVIDNDLEEDTKKLPNGRYANVGKDGKVDSGTFKTKKQADRQRRAIFANGFKEDLELEDSHDETFDKIDFLINDEQEAIDGYEDVSQFFQDYEDIEDNIRENVLYVLNHIKKEEETHIEELENLKKYLSDSANNSFEDLFSDIIDEETSEVKVDDIEESYKNKSQKKLKEDLKIYTSSLADFKPTTKAKDLWDEIIDNDKLNVLEDELSDIFKTDNEQDGSIDIDALNDLLINHPDFIKQLVGLDDSNTPSTKEREEIKNEYSSSDDSVIDDNTEEITDEKDDNSSLDDEPLDNMEEEDEEISSEEDNDSGDVDDDIEPVDLSTLDAYGDDEDIEPVYSDEEIKKKTELNNTQKKKEIEESFAEQLGQSYIKNNFKPQQLDQSNNIEEIKSNLTSKAIKETNEDDEIVNIDDNTLDELLGCPKTSKEEK